MPPLLTITHHTSVRLGEVGFLLVLIAGVWLVIAELLGEAWREFRMVVVGLCLAGAGVLLLIAVHWGSFG